MPSSLPTLYLVRHGTTAWSLTGQHTGLSDIPLTPEGEADARKLAPRLAGLSFARVFTSPLQRAARTCELAGFGERAELDPDLLEWNYGLYDGLLHRDIQARHPAWNVFEHGCPEGESPEQVAARADRVIDRVRKIAGDVLLFSSGHFLRMLAARWLALPPAAGQRFLLSTSSLSALTYEHDRDHPILFRWNDTRHLEAGA